MTTADAFFPAPPGARALDPRTAFAPERWSTLARAVGLAPDAGLVVALSGGADSVHLLHLVARARPRPPLVAVHVDHGLRGDESRADARFSAELCAALDVPFVARAIALDPRGPGLEARAREARYALLVEEARAKGFGAIATGHHADDALETLVARWIRGTPLPGLAALGRRVTITDGLRADPRRRTSAASANPLVLVRPLWDLGRDDVRRALVAHGIPWREDASNDDPRFARNRVRHGLLPLLAREGLPTPALAALHDELARLAAHVDERLAHLALEPAAAGLGGGSIERARLAALPPELLPHALWALVARASGAGPARATLARIAADVSSGRASLHALGRGWRLRVRDVSVRLEPPRAPSPFAGELELAVPGRVDLGDGRALVAREIPWPDASRIDPAAGAPLVARLDRDALSGPLTVRLPRPGDRVRPLGAPGTRPLVRVLSDAGVPSAVRGRVPLVCAAGAIAWVAGVRPAHDARLLASTRRALELRLELPAPGRDPAR